jgi:hypothetical protein
MSRIQFFRVFSILGAFLVGFWLPLRLIGYIPSLAVEVGFDFLISAVSAINIYLYFQQDMKDHKNPRDWLNLGLACDLICLMPLSLFAFLVFDVSADWLLFLNLLTARHINKIKAFLDDFDSLEPIISRSDAAREHHMDNLDKIETFIRLHHIPTHLRSKIRAYYHYLWVNKKGYQDHSLLEDLPTKIQSELFFYINKSIVEKVPFLRGADKELIEDLMNELEPRIYVPGERIFRVDEHGDALYIIHSGEVEILSRENAKIVDLSDGAFFGEMALISDQPRSATAKASTFCDIYLLQREAFDRVTAAYPQFETHLQEIVRDRKAA